MNIDYGISELYERALAECGELVARAAPTDLRAPSPCAGWDLAALLGHMIGQNHGFASAVEHGDADIAEYAPPAVDAGTLVRAWNASVERLRQAFARVNDADEVNLAELGRRASVDLARRMQLLDTAVHAWDVATSIGLTYRPDDAVVAVVHDFATVIAARPGGNDGVFAAPRGGDGGDGADRWVDALRLLGRVTD